MILFFCVRYKRALLSCLVVPKSLPIYKPFFLTYSSGKPVPLEFHRITVQMSPCTMCACVCESVCNVPNKIQTAETCSYLNKGGVQVSNHNGCSVQWVWSDNGFHIGCWCCCIADVMSGWDVWQPVHTHTHTRRCYTPAFPTYPI